MSVYPIPTDHLKGKKQLIVAILWIVRLRILGSIDYLAGKKVSLIVFYAPPVGFAAIHVGPTTLSKVLHKTKSRQGQTLVEYALILAFISVVAISVLIRLGGEVRSIFSTISSQIAIAGSSH